MTKNDIFQVYVHNPFCYKVCSYCAYKGSSYTKENYDLYYKKILPESIKYHKEVLSEFVSPTYWFGGGTPNLMKNEDMVNIFSLLEFDDSSHKIIEVHPNLLTIKQIDIFKNYGFTTISIGVQTFNKDILNQYNRDDIDYSLLKKNIEYIHSLDMMVSIDILTLHGSNTEQLYNDLFKVADLQVEEIVVAYDYVFKGDPKITRSFVNAVEAFLETSEYSTQDFVEDLYLWKLKKKAVQLTLKGFTHNSVLHYNSDLGIRKNISNYSTLGIGAWNNFEVISKINSSMSYITMLDNNKNFIKREYGL